MFHGFNPAKWIPFKYSILFGYLAKAPLSLDKPVRMPGNLRILKVAFRTGEMLAHKGHCIPSGRNSLHSIVPRRNHSRVQPVQALTPVASYRMPIRRKRFSPQANTLTRLSRIKGQSILTETGLPARMRPCPGWLIHLANWRLRMFWVMVLAISITVWMTGWGVKRY